MSATTSDFRPQTSTLDARWVLAPWALYVLLTGLLFHVELRYRLPLYPALQPYAGWVLASGRPRGWMWWRAVLAAGLCAAAVALMLLHQPYLGEALALARKHAALWQADRALGAGDTATASMAAEAALALDPDSALARVALAQATIRSGDLPAALAALDAAVEAVPDHPRAHMLRGALRRAQGDADGARADLSYETATLEDAQAWAWVAFTPIQPIAAELDIGGGLDLGAVRGFHAAEQGFRWTQAEAVLRLARGGAGAIELRLAGGRPAGAPAPSVTVFVNGSEVGRFTAEAGWSTHRFAIPAETSGELLVTIRSATFSPRDVDRASPDSRDLGVMVDSARLVAP
jgi:hypothetical protein